MFRKLTAVLLSIIVLSCLISPVNAQEYTRVTDQAYLLSTEEIAYLEDYAATLKESYGIDAVILTIESLMGHSARDYADNFYDEGMFGYDAPYGDGLILVDNWYQEADGGVYTWVSTSGKVMEQLSTEDTEFILDMCLDYVEDDPAYAYEYFVDLVVDYLDPNQNLGDDLGIFSVLVGLIAGFIFFVANRGGKKGKNTVETRTYVKNGTANIREKQDIFITKTVQRRKIETETTRSGGGGHISAGGHSHGGGGHRR